MAFYRKRKRRSESRRRRGLCRGWVGIEKNPESRWWNRWRRKSVRNRNSFRKFWVERITLHPLEPVSGHPNCSEFSFRPRSEYATWWKWHAIDALLSPVHFLHFFFFSAPTCATRSSVRCCSMMAMRLPLMQFLLSPHEGHKQCNTRHWGELINIFNL